MIRGNPTARMMRHLVARQRQNWNVCAKVQHCGPKRQPLIFGRRALPVRDIPVRSPAVSMADQARSHGSGSYRVDTHDPVAGWRDGTAVAVFTISGSCASSLAWPRPVSLLGRPKPSRVPGRLWRCGPFPVAAYMRRCVYAGPAGRAVTKLVAGREYGRSFARSLAQTSAVVPASRSAWGEDGTRQLGRSGRVRHRGRRWLGPGTGPGLRPPDGPPGPGWTDRSSRAPGPGDSRPATKAGSGLAQRWRSSGTVRSRASLPAEPDPAAQTG